LEARRFFPPFFFFSIQRFPYGLWMGRIFGDCIPSPSCRIRCIERKKETDTTRSRRRNISLTRLKLRYPAAPGEEMAFAARTIYVSVQYRQPLSSGPTDAGVQSLPPSTPPSTPHSPGNAAVLGLSLPDEER